MFEYFFLLFPLIHLDPIYIYLGLLIECNTHNSYQTLVIKILFTNYECLKFCKIQKMCLEEILVNNLLDNDE